MKNAFLRINKLAIPILSTYIMGFTFSLCDQAIISRTNLESYAAVTTVSNLLYYFIGSLGFLGVALNIHGSHLLDSGNLEKYAKMFNSSLTLSIAIGFLFFAICYFFGSVFLAKALGVHGELLKESYDYLKIVSLTLLTNMIVFLFSSFYKSKEEPKIIIYSVFIASIINTTISYILVFGELGFPAMGVKGAALGSVIAGIASVSIYLYSFIKERAFVLSLCFKKNAFKKLLHSYLNLSVQDFLEYTLFIFVITSIVSRLGVQSLAIFSLVNIVFEFIVLTAFSYGNASVAVLPKLHNINTALRYRNITLLCVAILFLAYLLFIYIFSNDIIITLLDKKELITGFNKIFYYASIMQLFHVLSIILKYFLNSLGLESWVLKSVSCSSTLSSALIYIFAAYNEIDLSTVFVFISLNHLFVIILCLIKTGLLLKKGLFRDSCG